MEVASHSPQQKLAWAPFETAPSSPDLKSWIKSPIPHVISRTNDSCRDHAPLHILTKGISRGHDRRPEMTPVLHCAFNVEPADFQPADLDKHLKFGEGELYQ